MKIIPCALLLAFILSSFSHQAKKRIVFFGDSITQAGVQPTGYITKMKQMLEAKRMDAQYELIGAGIGGNKIYDLYLRMEEDVLSKKPDVVVIWVGVNDVWHKQSSGTGTDADKFEKFYNAVIKKLQAANISVYLCTPAAIGEKTDFTNQLDGDLNKYSNIIRSIAKNNNCPVIDLRKSFLDYNLANNKDNKESGVLTTDRVHLNEKGNAFVATEMWNVLNNMVTKN
ncbi:MAG TPA: GDSL-type esterase/lipase family protein [Chitinophagaceae bacterium]|nr:GDSL-type esterase/lipase family protein [Chitinophagaceae bacterium]